MAAIGSIRKRAGLLAVVIGVSIVAFLLMDATSSQFNVFGNRGVDAGKIDGEKVDYTELQQRVSADKAGTEAQYMLQYGAIPEFFADNLDDQVRQQTWLAYVEEKLLQDNYEKLGLTVTEAEKAYIMGSDEAHPLMSQISIFSINGVFEQQAVKNFLSNITVDEPGILASDKQLFWAKLERDIVRDQLLTKYNDLISNGLYAPTWMGQMNYLDEASVTDFNYIYRPYSFYSDSLFKVTDSDIEKYLEENQAAYFQQEGRTIQYVEFMIEASSADSATALQALDALVYEDQIRKGPSNKKDTVIAFAVTEEDSAFVEKFSDRNLRFDPYYYTQNEIAALNPELAQAFYSDSGSNGQLNADVMYGPYFENGMYKYAKVANTKMIPDSVRISHIFIEIYNEQTVQNLTQEIVDAKESLLDSLWTVFNEDSTLLDQFGQTAAIYSDDLPTREVGGDLGYIKKGELNLYMGSEQQWGDPDMENRIFFNGKNDKLILAMTDRVELRQGGFLANYHIIRITDYTPTTEAVQYAILGSSLGISPQTEAEIKDEAYNFSSTYNTTKKFNEVIETDPNYTSISNPGLTRESYTLDPNQFGSTLGNTIEAVAWAFSAEEGEVSLPFRNRNGDRFVVVLVEQAREKGYADVSSLSERSRTRVEAEILAEKKTKEFKSAYDQAAGANLSEKANNLGLTMNLQANGTFAQTNLSALGLNEPAVFGTAYGLDAGSMSGVIQGENGAFVIEVTNKVAPPALTEWTDQKKAVQTNLANRTSNKQEIVAALKKKADIEDNRLNFYQQ